MIIMMFKSPTNQNNISLNNSIINMCTNSTTYIMIETRYKLSFVVTFQGSFPIGFQKTMFNF
jgi:hypothetical protein